MVLEDAKNIGLFAFSGADARRAVYVAVILSVMAAILSAIA